jgi:hypothetical protein
MQTQPMTTTARKIAVRSQQTDNLWRKVIAARIAFETSPTEQNRLAHQHAMIAWRNA